MHRLRAPGSVESVGALHMREGESDGRGLVR